MDVSNLKGVKAGDELLLTEQFGGRRKTEVPTQVVVHKVGTKLVHILRSPGQPEFGTLAFRIENGRANDDYGHSELWRPEDWEAEQQRDSLNDALRGHGIESWRGAPKSIAVLEAILDVLERAERGESV